MVEFFSQEQSCSFSLEETQSNNLSRISYGTDRLIEGHGGASHFDSNICTAVISYSPDTFCNFTIIHVECNISCTALASNFQPLFKAVNPNNPGTGFPGELTYDLA